MPAEDLILPGVIEADLFLGITTVFISKKTQDRMIAPKLCGSLTWSITTIILPNSGIFF